MPRRSAVSIAIVAALAGSGCKSRPSPAQAGSAASAPAAALPVLGASASAAAPDRAPAKPFNIVFITVDALRADMPWTGYPRPIAPVLTKLAAESVVYTHAYALSSYTSMSLGGLMAGRYPSELPRNGMATSTFGPESVLLAEVLREAGVATLGIHGHVYFAGDTGINQGFESWKLPPKITSMPAREGWVVDDKLADLAIEALRERSERAREKPGERFFLWVHFMDPHFSYARHEGQPRFSGSAYEGDAGIAPPGVALSETGQMLRNQHDGEVSFTDAQIGRLLAELGKLPFADQTAVVVTSDHGEAFGEQKSYYEHGHHVWEVTTRVPLLLRVPGVAPKRIDARRSHIDLARTLLELAGVKAPDSMRGTSLIAEMKSSSAAAPRDVVIDMPYTDQTPRRRALIHGDVKIVVTETEERPLLFDLGRDPSEQKDLARERAELLEQMKQRWNEVDRALPDFPAPRKSKRAY